MMVGKAVRLSPPDKVMKKYAFSLILHKIVVRGDVGSVDIGGFVDWEVDATSLTDAQEKADQIVRAEIATSDSWWTRTEVKEVAQ